MESFEIESILDSVKKKLGMDPEIMKEFDADIIDAINMALNTLTQFGLGPIEGFVIHDNSATWSDFLGNDKRLNMARSYVYIKVRLLFDPPQSSYAVTALQEQAKEFEFRLNTFVEATESFPPID